MKPAYKSRTEAQREQRLTLAASVLSGLVKRGQPPDEQRVIVREALAWADLLLELE